MNIPPRCTLILMLGLARQSDAKSQAPTVGDFLSLPEAHLSLCSGRGLEHEPAELIESSSLSMLRRPEATAIAPDFAKAPTRKWRRLMGVSCGIGYARYPIDSGNFNASISTVTEFFEYAHGFDGLGGLGIGTSAYESLTDVYDGIDSFLPLYLHFPIMLRTMEHSSDTKMLSVFAGGSLWAGDEGSYYHQGIDYTTTASDLRLAIGFRAGVFQFDWNQDKSLEVGYYAGIVAHIGALWVRP